MALPVTETDIVNRGLQRVGSKRIAAGALRTETSKQATEAVALYDICRRAELQRNLWRFSIRWAALRAIGTDSKLVTFGTWLIGTTYKINDVVTGSDGQIYYSLVASNIGNDPTTSLTKWTLYFGPLIAAEYVTTWGAGFTYEIGDNTIGSDGNPYISIAASNTNHNPVGDGNVHWIAGTATADANGYYAGELVHIGGTVYLSLQSSNTDVPPSSKWLTLTTQPTLALMNFIYPLGSGPRTNSATKNVFWLPNGFLCLAPQDPKAGQNLSLGAPDGRGLDDWLMENKCFTSTSAGPILFRFGADVSDPSLFHPMFVEGLGARIGMELAEMLTQSGAKVDQIEKQYSVFMAQARTKNAIETGPVYPPVDAFLQVRY